MMWHCALLLTPRTGLAGRAHMLKTMFAMYQDPKRSPKVAVSRKEESA